MNTSKTLSLVADYISRYHTTGDKTFLELAKQLGETGINALKWAGDLSQDVYTAAIGSIKDASGGKK